MNTGRLSWLLLGILFGVSAAPLRAAEKTDTPLGIAQTAAWFDSLQWTDVRDKPYVELRWPDPFNRKAKPEGVAIRGFLMSEDDSQYYLLCDGINPNGASNTTGGWPFMIQPISKKGWGPDRGIQLSTIELDVSVEQVVSEIHRRAEEDDRWHSSLFGEKISNRTSLFFLARCCSRQGRDDLAARLDRECATLPPPSANRPLTFRESIEKELGHVFMWRAVVDFGDLKITRPQLLERFHRIVRDFSGCEHVDAARGYINTLQLMIAEDEERARLPVAFESLTEEEKIRDLIFQLRDQNGHQWSQPGSCDIFEDWSGRREDGTTPAHQLAKLGYVAVPALIEAIDDKHLSRSVGYGRDFFFSHHVLTVGNCAAAVLSRISGRRIDSPRSAHAWWDELQAKGEKALLIEDVRGGQNAIYGQARRLAAIDPDAAVDALSTAVLAAKKDWDGEFLTDELGRIETAGAKEALRTISTTGPTLGSRIAAIAQLFRRGDRDVVALATKEWSTFDPPPAQGRNAKGEQPDRLVNFLATCGDPKAIEAIAPRFAAFPPNTRIGILDAVFRNRVTSEAGAALQSTLLPQTEALMETLAVDALADRVYAYGRSGTLGDVVYSNPRVCDMAAYWLAHRWPDRYRFTWKSTRLERDVEVVKVQNMWRAGQQLKPLAIPERPSHPLATSEPNIIAAVQCAGEIPAPVLRVGNVLTAPELVRTFASMHENLGKDRSSFRFSAERAGDQKGFIVEIEWVDAEPPAARNEWRYNVDIRLDEASLYSVNGSGGLEYRNDMADYKAELRALTKALEAAPHLPITILYRAELAGRRQH